MYLGHTKHIHAEKAIAKDYRDSKDEAYENRQVEREWVKRFVRDRGNHYEDNERDIGMRGRYSRSDHHRYLGPNDSRHEEEDCDWRMYMGSSSRSRDSKEGARIGRDDPDLFDRRVRDSKGPESGSELWDWKGNRDRSRSQRDEDGTCSSESDLTDAVVCNGHTEAKESDGYKAQVPNNTIMIRGLAQHITENDVRQDIIHCGLMPKDIRLIRKKDTGASRGFAFVEFNTLQEASQWMEMKQGVLMLQDQYRAIMHFSIPKDNHCDRSSIKSSQDWYCVKCGAHNFKRRDTCFKCHVSRQESEGGEGSDEVSLAPTQTVLLRGLDVLSSEDSVSQSIKEICPLTSNRVRIGQDSLTNTSRGVCYVEMNTILDAVVLYNALCTTPLVIDGRKVAVSYCKSNQAVAAAATAAAGGGSSNLYSASSSAGALTQYGVKDIPHLAEYSASLYATTPQEHMAYLQYYQQYYRSQLAQGGTITLALQSQADSVNAAAAVAQSAIQQLQASKEVKKQVDDPQHHLKPEDRLAYEVFKIAQLKTQSPTSVPASSTYVPNTSPSTPVDASSTPVTDRTKYPVPDVSTYQYDDTSGYYYDPQTGLYYDASSQYYYNSQTNQFLYWEAEKQTYLPAPIPPDEINATKEEGKKGKEKDRSDKVKVAKKIAKDMERWAKTLNQKKDNARQNLRAAAVNMAASKSFGAADAGYAVLERKERLTPNSNQAAFSVDDGQGGSPNAQMGINSAAGLVAAYGGGSDSDEEIEDVLHEDRQHTNWVKLACLLCKRQFPTKESLVRHQQLSDLHKENLDTWYRVRGLDPNDPQQRNSKYRDRAKERRQKFGEPNPPHPNHLKEKYLKAREEVASSAYDEPTKDGIGSDNVGNKLLHKMGWHEGMGLGKTNQGQTSIIKTEQRVANAGLGCKGAAFGQLPGETYKDCVKKMMFARYQELSEQDDS